MKVLAALLKTAGFSEGLQALRKHWFSTGHNVNNVMSWLQLLKRNRHLVTGQLAAPAAEQHILVFCEHFHLAFTPSATACVCLVTPCLFSIFAIMRLTLSLLLLIAI